MQGKFTLGKEEKLKSRKKIEQLFSEGTKFSVGPIRIYYFIKNEMEIPTVLFGTGVSAKTFKKAVERNRIKRLMREAYRLQKNNLKNSATELKKEVNLFFIYNGKELPDYKYIFELTGKALKKLEDQLK